MHDLDRTLREFESGIDALESGDYESEEETNGSGMMGEVEELEYAANLLEVSDEQELDQFFGKLLRSAVSGAKALASTPAGQALVGVLKDAAGKALPTVAGAIGGAIGGSTGQRLGQQAGGWAKSQLGWEVEGEGGGDQEFETAQSLVRVATTAAQQLAQAPSSGSPVAAARKAAISAAQQVAPQLIRAIASAGSRAGGARGGTSGGRSQSGRWLRRGNAIILIGV